MKKENNEYFKTTDVTGNGNPLSKQDLKDFIDQFSKNVGKSTFLPTAFTIPSSLDDLVSGDIDHVQTVEETIVNNIVLLPRSMGGISFTDEQLKEFLDESWKAVFDIDRLKKYDGNDEIQSLEGKNAVPKTMWVDQKGLMGNVVIINSGESLPDMMAPSSHKTYYSLPSFPSPLDDLVKKSSEDLSKKIEERLLESITINLGLQKTGEETKNGTIYTKPGRNQES